MFLQFRLGTRGGPLGRDTALQAVRSRVQFSIFHWLYSSSRTVVMGSSQPLTEMSTRSVSWG